MAILKMKSSLIIASLGMFVLNSAAYAIPSNPCLNIAKACMDEGFVKNGPEGKRLALDCIKPVVENQKTVSYVPSDDEKEQCKTFMMEEMKQH